MSPNLTATVDGQTFVAREFKPRGKPKATLFCLPGGGASAEYFDLAPDNSFVRIMTAKGYHVITMDHPGTVTNPLPDDHEFLTPRQSAAYISQALTQWTEGNNIYGMGHSMGGMMTTLVQAQNQPFKAIGLFGSSAGGLEWGLSEAEKKYIDKPEDLARDLDDLTLAKFKTPFPKGMGGPSGKSITFGGETPALTQRLRETSCELYAAGGMMSMVRGSFRKDVEGIDIPIFFAFGDHDIGIPPEDAPKDYINAPSTELIVLPHTGHNHFAFKSISILCDKLDYWLSGLD